MMIVMMIDFACLVLGNVSVILGKDKRGDEDPISCDAQMKKTRKDEREERKVSKKEREVYTVFCVIEMSLFCGFLSFSASLIPLPDLIFQLISHRMLTKENCADVSFTFSLHCFSC